MRAIIVAYDATSDETDPKPPDGVCMGVIRMWMAGDGARKEDARNRRDDPDAETVVGKTAFFAIVCQSEHTGKACFWDSVDPNTGGKVFRRLLSDKLEIAKIADGYSLKNENCTDCHRGPNAFLIRPQTALDLPAPFDIHPRQTYQPMGRAGWQNPRPLLIHDPNGNNKCATCHEIPGLSEKYCAAVLANVSETYMPSASNPVGWKNPSGPYASDVLKLKQQCTECKNDPAKCDQMSP